MTKKGSRPKKVLTGAARRAMVDRVAALMREGKPTRWAFEAALRHSLRSGWCLDLPEMSWAALDAEAAAIIGEAERRITGGFRPRADDGFDAHHDCVHCGKPLTVDAYDARFCSFSCALTGEEFTASTESRLWRFAGDLWDVQAHVLAHRQDALRMLRVPNQCQGCGRSFLSDQPRKWCSAACYHEYQRKKEERTCAVCKGSFYPNSGNHDQTFCSNACRLIARREALPERPCDQCGEIFRPYHAAARYCSTRCNARAQDLKRRRVLPPRDCMMCGASFTPQRSTRMYCSKACGDSAARARAKVKKADAA